MIRRPLIALLLLAACGLAAQPTEKKNPSDEAPDNTDPQLWSRLLEINERSRKIQDLSADFRQEKHTAMLKRPLVSTGTVLVRGDAMRWDTSAPEPTVMLITEGEVRIYYPQQKVMEIFRVDQQLASLAASPLPRLSVLREHFHFEPLDVREIDEDADATRTLAVRLIPRHETLAEHITAVRVLLDADAGYIMAFEMIDADEDRTVIRFSDVKANTNIGPEAFELDLPRDVTITRPLERMESGRRG